MSDEEPPQSSVTTNAIVLRSTRTLEYPLGTMGTTTPTTSSGDTMIGSQTASPVLSPSAPEFVPGAAVHGRRPGESRDDHYREVSQISYSRQLNTYGPRFNISSSHFVHRRLSCVYYPFAE